MECGSLLTPWLFLIMIVIATPISVEHRAHNEGRSSQPITDAEGIQQLLSTDDPISLLVGSERVDVHDASTQWARWPPSIAQNITWCVASPTMKGSILTPHSLFASDKDERQVIAAFTKATALWERFAKVKFERLDLPLCSIDSDVWFVVVAGALSGEKVAEANVMKVLLSWLSGEYGQPFYLENPLVEDMLSNLNNTVAPWRVVREAVEPIALHAKAMAHVIVDLAKMRSWLDLHNVALHEIGHVLGMSHEHLLSNRQFGAGCDTYDDPLRLESGWRLKRVTTYEDFNSVMAYAHCGGTLRRLATLSQGDRDGIASIYGQRLQHLSGDALSSGGANEYDEKRSGLVQAESAHLEPNKFVTWEGDLGRGHKFVSLNVRFRFGFQWELDANVKAQWSRGDEYMTDMNVKNIAQCLLEAMGLRDMCHFFGRDERQVVGAEFEDLTRAHICPLAGWNEKSSRGVHLKHIFGLTINEEWSRYIEGLCSCPKCVCRSHEISIAIPTSLDSKRAEGKMQDAARTRRQQQPHDTGGMDGLGHDKLEGSVVQLEFIVCKATADSTQRDRPSFGPFYLRQSPDTKVEARRVICNSDARKEDCHVWDVETDFIDLIATETTSEKLQLSLGLDPRVKEQGVRATVGYETELITVPLGGGAQEHELEGVLSVDGDVISLDFSSRFSSAEAIGAAFRSEELGNFVTSSHNNTHSTLDIRAERCRLTKFPSFLVQGTVGSVASSLSLAHNRISGNELVEFSPRGGTCSGVTPLSTGLRHIDLSGNELTDVAWLECAFPHLETVDVSNNRMRELPSRILSLARIRSVSASNNDISAFPEIPSSSVGNHVNNNGGGLQKLLLSGNAIISCESLKPDTITTLKRLTLSSNGLSHVSLSTLLDAFPQLEELDLSDNHLVEIGDGAEGEGEGGGDRARDRPLQTLVLDNNRLTQLPNIVGTLPHLRVLRLSQNQLVEIDTALLPTSLSILSANRNQLRKFETTHQRKRSNDGGDDDIDALCHLESLREIHLSSNELSYLPSCPCPCPHCPRLSSVQLWSNKLRTVPVWMWELTPVNNVTLFSTLDLSNNRITELAPPRKECLHLNSASSRLGVLSIHNNHFRDLDAVLRMLPSLRKCKASNNMFEVVGRSPHLHLEELQVDHNRISTVKPLSIAFPSLLVFNASHNSINEVSDKSILARSLKYVDLSHNGIGIVSPNEISATVQHLDLSYNNITEFPRTVFSNSFSDIPSLTSLDLSHNQVRIFDMGLISIGTSFKFLRFSYNNISKLDGYEAVLGSLSINHFEEMDFRGNNFDEKTFGCKDFFNTYRLRIPTQSLLLSDNPGIGRCSLDYPTREDILIFGIAGAHANTTKLKVRKARSFSPKLFELRHLEQLKIRESWLGQLPDIPPGVWPDLRILDLKFTHLRKVPKELFALPSLTVLRLSQNFLVEIPLPDHPNPALQELELNYNQINRLPNSFFTTFPNLSVLFLAFNGLRSLPSSLTNSSVAALSLHDNPLDVPDILCKAPKLEFVMVPTVRVPTCLFNYTEVNYKGVQLNADSQTGLSSVYFSGTLTRFQRQQMESLPSNHDIKRVVIVGSGLRRLPNPPPKLDYFVMKDEPLLTVIPDTFFEMAPNLRVCVFRNTPIRSLPNSLGKLKNLQTLILENVKITSLPSTISECTTIERLEILSVPTFTSLPQGISNLSLKSWLYIADTGLASIPRELAGCKANLIRLVGNKLTEVPWHLWTNTTHTVILEGNEISSTDGFYEHYAPFRDMVRSISENATQSPSSTIGPSITRRQIIDAIAALTFNSGRLVLDHNNIRTLPEFMPLFFPVLSVTHNQLTHFSHDASDAMHEVRLDHNRLTTLPSFYDANNLKLLSFSYNRLKELPSMRKFEWVGLIAFWGNPLWDVEKNGPITVKECVPVREVDNIVRIGGYSARECSQLGDETDCKRASESAINSVIVPSLKNTLGSLRILGYSATYRMVRGAFHIPTAIGFETTVKPIPTNPSLFDFVISCFIETKVQPRHRVFQVRGVVGDDGKTIFPTGASGYGLVCDRITNNTGSDRDGSAHYGCGSTLSDPTLASIASERGGCCSGVLMRWVQSSALVKALLFPFAAANRRALVEELDQGRSFGIGGDILLMKGPDSARHFSVGSNDECSTSAAANADNDEEDNTYATDQERGESRWNFWIQATRKFPCTDIEFVHPVLTYCSGNGGGGDSTPLLWALQVERLEYGTDAGDGP